MQATTTGDESDQSDATPGVAEWITGLQIDISGADER